MVLSEIQPLSSFFKIKRFQITKGGRTALLPQLQEEKYGKILAVTVIFCWKKPNCSEIESKAAEVFKLSSRQLLARPVLDLPFF